MSASSNSNAQHWYVLTRQGERGPYSTTALKRFAWQGHIHRVTQVRLEHGEWFQAGRVEGLWDIRWRRPNGELIADGQAAAQRVRSPKLPAGVTNMVSLIRTVKTWLTKSCVFAACAAGGNTNRHV